MCVGVAVGGPVLLAAAFCDEDMAAINVLTGGVGVADIDWQPAGKRIKNPAQYNFFTTKLFF